ncbi:MAG: hypothetical protein OXD29_04975 [Roseovarius sp.]|nr:hypothetical protein [Roseovarius sp.]MCY4207289.1 hypothetical protein [Roseovarius sp.]MCY4291387.1 hypothetical protein [Roseovarius sp.]
MEIEPAMTGNLDKIRLFADTHAIEAANFTVIPGFPIDRADIERFTERLNCVKAAFPAVSENTQVPGKNQTRQMK